MPKFYMSPVKGGEVDKVKNPKLLRKNDYAESIVYMQNKDSEREFLRSVQDGDTIELHGHGNPWIFGGAHRGDYTAIDLAQYFQTLFGARNNIRLTIDLRFCNSGSEATGKKGNLCYARNFSRVLFLLGLPNISVKGYSGYLTYDPKNPIKLTTVDNWPSSYKSKHKKRARIENAFVVYENGALVHEPVERPVSKFRYSKDQSSGENFKRHIEQCNELRRVVLERRARGEVAEVDQLAEQGYVREQQDAKEAAAQIAQFEQLQQDVKEAAAQVAQSEQLKKQQQELEALEGAQNVDVLPDGQQSPVLLDQEFTPLQDAYRRGLASNSPQGERLSEEFLQQPAAAVAAVC